MIGSYGHLGVEVFFVVSGFVIPYSMYVSSYKINMMGRFLLKRAIRIEIPYLVVIVLEVILMYVSSLTPWKNGVSERLVISEILLHAAYLNGVLDKPWLIPAFWTLAIEFQFYLLIALLFPLFTGTNTLKRVLVIACIATLSFIFPQPHFFFSHALFFLIGIITFQVACKIIQFREFVGLSTVILFLLMLQRAPIYLLIVLVAIIVILFMKLNWKWASFLGMISYSLYLIHVPFGGRLLVLTQMFVHDERIKSLLIISFLGATVLVAWLFYLLIENPSVVLSKKIVYKNIK
jgi:peptidoglycan/LPS O-acetylase OafA/YrhL